MAYICCYKIVKIMNGKYLITTDAWFYANDGKQYKAAWGEVEILQDNILGIKTNSRSTNWYAKVGNSDKFVIIAGCQIHYAIKCENKPNFEMVENWATNDKKECVIYNYPSPIYIAE